MSATNAQPDDRSDVITSYSIHYTKLYEATGACVLALAPGAALAASQPAVEAANGMVVSSQRLASEAGVAVLRAGGNAVDAAVAVGYALAVVNPCCA